MKITFDRIDADYRTDQSNTPVLQKACCVFPEGKITALLGASGSGKTTCLQLLAGLLAPTSGNILREMTDRLGNVTRETKDARISYLFQDPALLPWLTAIENVNLVLSDKKETLDEATYWLQQVELGEHLNRYPHELSGGMKQRVGLARALAADADLLLLDEPFRGMDEQLHLRMRDLIAKSRRGKTTVLVTHDIQDTAIADVVLKIEEKAIVQVK